MTPTEFQTEYRPSAGLITTSFPVLQSSGQDHLPRAELRQSGTNAGAQRPQSGFLTQSVDEIARLYVESPFSW